MDAYYGPQYGANSSQDFDGLAQHNAHDEAMSGMDEVSSLYRHSDDQHHDQQSRHPLRNASLSNLQATKSPHPASNNERRQSMPEFSGMANDGQLNSFQFAPSNTSAQTVMMPIGAMFQNQQLSQPMHVVTQYIGNSGNQYSMMSPVQTMQQSPVHMSMQGNMQMAMLNQNDMMNSMQSPMAIPGGHAFVPGVTINQMPQASQTAMQQPNSQDAGAADGGGAGAGSSSSIQSSPTHQSNDPLSHMRMPRNNHTQVQTPSNLSHVQSMSEQQSLQPVATSFESMNFGGNNPSNTNSPQARFQAHQRQQQQLEAAQQHWAESQGHSTFERTDGRHNSKVDFSNAYSSSGFDMLNILVRVATRPEPEINIGAVDLSCAFVVCDANEHDFPIIYVSENFERLTGYTKHEILGRNCRFLQSPTGKVQPGVKRQYVDDESVTYLKNMISQRREAQVSLINYRKGGQPFMNLLTMIPVRDDQGAVRYFVGFQVDLVEQPNSVTNKNRDGSYTVNYQRGLTMPRYTFNRPEAAATASGQTVSRDDVSAVLSTIGSGESELAKRIWDKVLLENSDDVIFVLSLKGLFLYLSPSSKNVLEYEPAELMGTALSSICHPSDIVPVTRELKDTAANADVDVVFRVRRKGSGYMWFEGHGSLHTEQGKGRKSIVLVGRERPVYSLSTTDIVNAGGIGDNEVWTKLSTSAMFLFVSSNIRAMLDRTPQELVGTSIQSLMRSDSRNEFQRVLELARSGRRASVKHELLNKRGQVLQAVSTVYPGDSSAGSKPTFFVAQTRLVKYTRPSGQGRSVSGSKADRESTAGSATGKHPSPAQSQGSRASLQSGLSSTQGQTLPSPSRFMGSFEATTTFGGADALPLGRQDEQLASDFNLFDELKTTRSTSWQFELRQMEKRNRLLAEELQGLLAARKKRKRRKGAGMLEKDCANCHTKQTPEWRRGPSGNRDLCNSCGLRWAKQQGRISPRNSSHRSEKSDGKKSGSPADGSIGGASAHGSDSARRQSIDEALANGQSASLHQPQATDGTSQSSHVSKSQRIQNAINASPDTPLQPFGSVQGGRSFPTKIEETDESDFRAG